MLINQEFMECLLITLLNYQLTFSPYLSSYWSFGEKTEISDLTSEQDKLDYENDKSKKYPNVDWSKSSWNNAEVARSV